MNARFLLYLLAGLAFVGALVLFSLYTTKGAHLELKGEILKVRLLPLGERATLVVVDFRATNVADYPFMVRSTEVTVEKTAGETVAAMPVSRPDMERVFQYHRLVGPKYNEILTIRDRIAPHQTVDRMVAARVELPESEVVSRKRLRLRIEDTDGGSSELTEKK